MLGVVLTSSEQEGGDHPQALPLQPDGEQRVSEPRVQEHVRVGRRRFSVRGDAPSGGKVVRDEHRAERGGCECGL